jgi:hypothetical protein
MNWDALGAIAELAGAVAVVASLLYLGRQFRHSSTYALESIYYQAVASFTSSPEVASVVSRGMSDLDSLTDEEQYHFFALFHQLFSAVEQFSEQSTRGLANPGSVERIRKVAHSYMANPEFQILWHHGGRGALPLKGMFSRRFVAELEDAAGTEPPV